MNKTFYISVLLLLTFLGAQVSPWLNYAQYCSGMNDFLENNYKSLAEKGLVKKLTFEKDVFEKLGFADEDEIVYGDKLCDVLKTEIINSDVIVYIYEDVGETAIVKMIAANNQEQSGRSSVKLKLDDYIVWNLIEKIQLKQNYKEYITFEEYIHSSGYSHQIIKPPILLS